MAVEALPFVNWAFWQAISAGTILVVGMTELLGGTTRGYRLFMAALTVALAGVLVASELALTPGVEADATAAVRRPLTLGFAVACLAYLVASVARWPRSWLAIGAGAIGLGALVSLAAADATDGAPLFAVQLVVAALTLGSVNAAMLLGHWYLVTPQLSPVPLRRIMWLLLAALALQGVAFGCALLVVGTSALDGGIGWLTWLRLGVGVVLPMVVTGLALAASRAPSLQATTGLLYIGLALVMAGSIAGTSISYITGVPV